MPPVWPEGPEPSRRWIYSSILLLCVAIAACYVYRPWKRDIVSHFARQLLVETGDHSHHSSSRNTIRLGILQSLTGPMAISEQSMVDAELMAVDEINESGGLLGRQVEAVVRDGKSDPRVFAVEAEWLIEVKKVCSIIGCYTSASRLAVKEVVTRNDHLLIYPKSFEGFELSENIVYTGAAPNQQVSPAVRWSFDNLGKRFYLVSTDHPDSNRGWSVSSVVLLQLRALRGEVVGQYFVPPDRKDFDWVAEDIKRARPDVIFSSVAGDSNIRFYEALHRHGVTNPVVSVSIGEDEIQKLPASSMSANYVASSYFQSLDSPENKAFVARFKKKYGPNRVTSDVIEAAYVSVLLWAQAVAEAEADPGDERAARSIRRNLLNQSLDAPEGVVSIERETHYTWRSFSIGKIRPDGQIEVVWTARKPIRPAPYPQGRSEAEWSDLAKNLHREATEDSYLPFDEDDF